MMGEPVTTGMMIGAATGALTNRRNPLQGAMLGGAMGAAGGSFYGGAAGAGSAGGGFAGGGYGSVGASPTFGQSIGAGFTGLGKDISAANTWMNQNPISSQLGFKLAEQAIQSPEQVPMPGGMSVNRGQIQPMDYMSLLNPQQPTVIRPATPSLI
jgi:hypothetical protein